VQVCSCSWPNDEWEHVMASYADRLCINGPARKGSIKFHYMKFHEDHAKLRTRIDEHLRGKHLVVQCEQGVDFFHEPVTGEWLQDNYEDNMVHLACTNYVERVGVPSLLLQTNADLDLTRGIDGDDLDASIFGGQMQTDAFNQRIEFKPGEVTDLPQPHTLIKLAVHIGQEKKKQLEHSRELLLGSSSQIPGENKRMFSMLDRISTKLLGSVNKEAEKSTDKVADEFDEQEFEKIVMEAEYEELIEQI